jgi:hypothetical protein
MSRKVLALVGGILLILAVAGGSFYGGTVYAQQQTANARAAFFADRGGGTGGSGGTGGGEGGAGGGFFGGGSGANGGGRGGGAGGQIKSIDGDTITLSTPQREVKVRITDTTQFQKVVAGERGDLAVGDNITVRGQADANGNVTADSIQVGGAVSIPSAP